jgi:hypothetical protein
MTNVGVITTGLWLEDLTENLMWLVHRPGTRDWESTAPTWSWASRYGIEVYFGANNYTNCKTVYYSLISVECVPLSKLDPYGRLSSARLVISAYLLPFELRYDEDIDGYLARTQDRGGITVYVDIYFEYDKGSGECEGEYYGVPILRSDWNYCCGLIMQCISEMKFIRVGTWFCTDEIRATRGEWSAEEIHAACERMERQTVTIL